MQIESLLTYNYIEINQGIVNYGKRNQKLYHIFKEIPL